MRRLALAVPLAALLASAAALAVPPPSPVLVVPVTVAAQSAAQSALAAHALELAPPTLALADAQVPQLHEAPVLATAAAPVLAQAVVPTVLERLVDVALSPLVLGGLLSLAGLALGAKQVGAAVRKRRVALVVKQAFYAVEDWKREFPGSDALAKAAKALDFANGFMLANGWRELTEEEQLHASLTFKSLHGEEKAKAETLARAQVQAVAQLAAQATLAPAVAREVHTPDPLTARAG